MNNKNTLMMWVVLLSMAFMYSIYKQKQAAEDRQKQAQQMRADSLATLAKAVNAASTAAMKDASKDGKTAVADSVHRESLPAMTRRALTVETKLFRVRLDNKGAEIAGVTLKDLDGHKPYNPEIIPQGGEALTLTVDNQDLSQQLWQVDAPNAGPDSVIEVGAQPVTVTFKTSMAGGKNQLVRSYTFYKDSSKIAQHLESASPLNSYAVGWPSGLAETEKIPEGSGFGLMNNFFSELILDNGATVQRTSFVDTKTFNDQSGVVKWVGLRRKYVAALLNFNRETADKVVATGKVPEGRDKGYPKDYKLQVIGNNVDEKSLDFDFVILPLSYDQLLAYHQNYEKIIFSGWESFFRADVWYVALCGLVLHVLKFFHGFVHNYGIAIIMLTLLVRTLTFPLTIAQTKQGVKMQQHAPAIQKIREKNKGNAQKANMEIMEYYKKEGVNPLSGVMGCFPMLLQMPIFFSLFNVFGRSVELKGAPFMLWIHDLSMPDVVLESFKLPYVFPLGVTILPFFVALTQFFQLRMTIKDPNQKMMIWLMPIMIFLFSCAFPSGLVLYWIVTNLFTIGQTYFFTNRMRPAAAKPSEATLSKPLSKKKPANT